MIKKSMYKVVIGLSSVIIIGVGLYFGLPYYKNIGSEKAWKEVSISSEEEKLYTFVSNELIDEQGGVYTNYIDNESKGDITKGHDVLSESQGLLLLYYLEKDDKEGFEKTLDYIKENMLLEENLLSWRVEHGKKSNTSATIDDFRVVKALLLANEKWNNFKYRVLALNISKGIDKNLLDDYIITDFKDQYDKSKTTTLCYLDLFTLKMLANLHYNNTWEKVYDKALKIVNDGYIGDQLPLYRKTYYRENMTYDNENIDSLLSMIVILNKAEVGQDVSKSIEWIRTQFKENGKIFTSYGENDGLAKSEIESTSIYALIVQIANKLNDKEIQTMAMNRMNEFQVKNKSSKVYGAYGEETGVGVYSYDNLNALLAYRSYED